MVASGQTSDGLPPRVFCGASKVLVRSSDSVRLIAIANPREKADEFRWAVTAGVITGSGYTVTWSFKGVVVEQNSQTAFVVVQHADGNRSSCAVEVWMTSGDNIRTANR